MAHNNYIRVKTNKGKKIEASSTLIKAVQEYLLNLPEVPSRSGKIPSVGMIRRVIYGTAKARYISDALHTVRSNKCELSER